MVAIASPQVHADREASRETFKRIVEGVSAQMEQLYQLEMIRPFRLPQTGRWMFRTNPGPILQAQVTLDVPDAAWLSPTDPYGKIKYDRYRRRVAIPVPGTEIDWGKLNRIVAERVGGRQIVFKSIPITKECWYATDDEYTAQLIREHIRRAHDQRYPMSDFRFVYEVDSSRKLSVDGFLFDDDDIGHAQAFAYMRETGAKTLEIVSDEPEAALLGEVDLPEDINFDMNDDLMKAMAKFARQWTEDQVKDQVSPMQEARAVHDANQAALLPDFDTRGPATKPAKTRKQPKAKLNTIVPEDPLDEFDDLMASKPDMPVSLTADDVSSTADPDILAVNDEGNIADLVEDVTDDTHSSGNLEDGGSEADGSEAAQVY